MRARLLKRESDSAIRLVVTGCSRCVSALLLPLARTIARDVVVTGEREGIDSEVVERPVAVLGNEREPVCMFFLQLIAP
jgi:hypothetical protein